MGKVIELEGPTFIHQEDEEIFFNCIYRIPSFKKVTGAGLNLMIEFKSEPSETDLVQLVIICKRWNIDLDPLENLCRESSAVKSIW